MIFPTGQLDCEWVPVSTISTLSSNFHISSSNNCLPLCDSSFVSVYQSISYFHWAGRERGRTVFIRQPLIGNDLMISSIMSIRSGLFLKLLFSFF